MKSKKQKKVFISKHYHFKLKQMIEEQVSKLSMLYHSVLAKQGSNTVMQNMQQTALEFMISTNNELQNNLDDLSFSESSDLGIMIAGYSFTLETLRSIEKGENNHLKINKSIEHIQHSYYFYEVKYNQELEYRNKQQREDYINSILLPLMMLIDFLNKSFSVEELTQNIYKKFRLIEISDYNDPNLGETTLLVKLSEIYENDIFYPDKIIYFFFLLDEHHKDYFLTNPENIKEIKLDEFISGNINKNDGSVETYYRHIDYANYFMDYEFITELEMNGLASKLKKKMNMLKDLDNGEIKKEIKKLTQDIEDNVLKIKNEHGDLERLKMMNRTFNIFLGALKRIQKNRNY